MPSVSSLPSAQTRSPSILIRVPCARAVLAGESCGSIPRSAPSRVMARYMRPLSMNGRPSTSATRFPTADLPEATPPSMVTITGSPPPCAAPRSPRRDALLVDLVARMSQTVGDLAVVSDQQQPGGVCVQPPDREHAMPRRAFAQHVENAGAAGLVLRGGDHSQRLVEHQVAVLGRGLHGPTVHGDDVAGGVHQNAVGRRHVAVDQY